MASATTTVYDRPKVPDVNMYLTPSKPSTLSGDEEYTLQEQRKIIHRVDRRLVVTCGVLYCVSLMDRTNLGQAAIAGMTAELKLAVGFRYVGLHTLI